MGYPYIGSSDFVLIWLEFELLVRTIVQNKGFNDNASIHSISTFVEHYNQTTFSIFNFQYLLLWFWIRIYIYPEIYIMKKLQRPLHPKWPSQWVFQIRVAAYSKWDNTKLFYLLLSPEISEITLNISNCVKLILSRPKPLKPDDEANVLF